MKPVTSKYPDVTLAKALRNALKVNEADPYRAQIVWRRAYELVKSRGVSVSFGDGGGGLMHAQPLDPDAEIRQQALDGAHWILASVLSMGRFVDAEGREGLAACARFFDAGRHRRPPRQRKNRPLTSKQRRVLETVLECGENFAEAAKRLNRDRSTVRQQYKAAMKKMENVMPRAAKPKTQRLPTDYRGQEIIVDRQKPTRG